jgi:hypothetical protein
MRLNVSGMAIALAVLCAFDSMSCQQSGSAVKGLNLEGPLNGKWRVTRTIDSDPCNLAGIVDLATSIVDIVQTGEDLDIVGDACCCIDQTRWIGVIKASSMTFASVRSVRRDDACTLRVEESDVASLHDDTFAGDASLTISDTASGCGAGFPCSMHSSFEGSRCQGSECTFVCAAVICPRFACPGF